MALSDVKVFGTEDRKKDNPIHASDNTMKYVIFRGNDIKEITVIENPPSIIDPAILSFEIGDKAKNENPTSNKNASNRSNYSNYSNNSYNKNYNKNYGNYGNYGYSNNYYKNYQQYQKPQPKGVLEANLNSN